MIKSKYFLPALSAICAIAVAVMLLLLMRRGKAPDFTPPAFDGAAQTGLPEAAGESWTKVHRDGMAFTAYVCGNVAVRGGSADVYFTNAADNAVWLKLRITDAAGNILGETGVVKPGEYVRSVALDPAPASNTEIILKIMSYEPETWHSAGAVSLRTTAGS